VKTCDEFGNDPMKMCFEHKTKMKVDYKIKDVIIVIFIKYIIIYDGAFFVMRFLCLGM
jgi:hypothetical protein